MARGDSNLLFNPPAIRRKPASDPAYGQRGSFPLVAEELFLTAAGVVLRDDEDDLLLMDKEMNPSPANIPHIKEGGAVSVNSSGIAFGDSQGFVVRSKAYGRDQTFYKNPLPGPLLGLYLSLDDLYCLWQDEKSGEKVLSTSALKNEERGWAERERYTGDVTFITRGDQTLLIFQDSPESDPSFLTIWPEGPGERLLVRAHPFKTTPKPNLVTPTRDGGYFALEHGTWGDEVTLIAPNKYGDTQEAAGRQRVVSLIGQTRENWKDIASWGDRGVLLGDNTLLVFARDKQKKEIALEPIDRGFDRVCLYKNRALLWRQGSSSYLEIPLPDLSWE